MQFRILSFLVLHASFFSLSPNFDTSMGKDHLYYSHYYNQAIKDPCGASMLARLRALYEKNKPENLPAQQLKIPKIIHHIWLGSPLPKKFERYLQSWRTHHPDWHHILWNNKEIEAFNLENKKAYDSAINYAERSDIARYEILYRFGGLYVDTDFECLQSFESLHYYYDFYTGLELPCMVPSLRSVIIPNGLIGSIPAHPILRAMIDAIMTHKISQENEHEIVIKTGPVLFSDIIHKHIDQEGLTDIVFPASYFYPIDKKTKGEKIHPMIRPETMAIHHWAGSWIYKKEAFVPGIDIRCVQEGDELKFKITRVQ